MTFRRPNESIIVRASRSAPLPIASMLITAPTPKIMPRRVSSVRSL